MADYTWEQNRADAQALADMLWAIYSCPVPVVGRIHGDCYAGGVGLAAVCDVLRRRRRRATFCLSEARLGLLPATISPYVIRAIGEQAARRYFVTAERFGAARGAGDSASCTRSCAADALDAKVDEIVAALVANGPMAVRACKQLVQDVAGRAIDAALRAETARRIADIRASDEGREGMQSFLDKRTPAWLTRSASATFDTAGGCHATLDLDTAQLRRHRRRARLGQRPAPVRRRLPHRHGRLRSAGSHLPARPARAAEPGRPRRQRADAVRRVLRRQDPRPRQRLGHGPHASSASRPARRSPAAVFGGDQAELGDGRGADGRHARRDQPRRQG